MPPISRYSVKRAPKDEEERLRELPGLDQMRGGDEKPVIDERNAPGKPPRGGMSSVVPRGPVAPAPDAGKGEDPQLFGLAKLRADQEKQRQATADDLKASKAKALQTTEARAGLSGMGLSGATSALRGDVARVQDRGAVLAMGDLDKQQRDAQFQETQRLAALYDLEDADGNDYDGDGVVGSPVAAGSGETQDDANKDRQSTDRRERIADLISSNSSVDIGNLDWDTGPGTKEEPFEIDASDLDDMKREGFRLKPFTYRVQSKASGHDEDFELLVDQAGRYYIVRS